MSGPRWSDEECRKAAFDVMLDYSQWLAELHVGRALLALRTEVERLTRERDAALAAVEMLRGRIMAWHDRIEVPGHEAVLSEMREAVSPTEMPDEGDMEWARKVATAHLAKEGGGRDE